MTNIEQSIQHSLCYKFKIMSAKNEIQESLSSIMLFLRLFKTFQLGQLVNICQLLQDEPTLYEQKVLSRMLVQFIFHINQENKKSHTQHEYLSIMIVQSLIYNLFRLTNKNQINNSIYSNSIMISSASQIGLNDQSTYSIKHYDNAENSLASFTNFVHDFISDSELSKKFKQMVERGGRKNDDGTNQNQRYIDILLETVEYILNKEGKWQKNGQLQYLREIIPTRNAGISSHYEKKNLKKNIKDVNKIIFSNKLNRIVFLLEEASEKVYFSLLRIYLGQSHHDQNQKKKSFKYYTGIDYSGQQMLLNINWIYIQSIANKNQLFETPKNPLFKLIQSYLLNCFMPVFRSFHEVVSKCYKYDAKGLEFYSKCEHTITKDLCQFIDLLPQSLLDYLKQIYYITAKSSMKSNKKQSNQNIYSLALVRVKKLLVYSLLVQPTLIEAYYSQGVDLQKYEQVCNSIINLFFKSSLKIYNNLNESQVECVANLTKLISKRIDDIILETENDEYDQFQRVLEVRNYTLEVPVLNHDYEILWEAINSVQFTPKDQKQFAMHHKDEIGVGEKILMVSQAPNLIENPSLTNFNYGGVVASPRQSTFSPMMRGKKDSIQLNDSINCFENGLEEGGVYQSQSIQFLAWMTVGGSRDYQAKPYRNRGASTQKLKELSKITAFPRQKIRQIQKLYEQYERVLL